MIGNEDEELFYDDDGQEYVYSGEVSEDELNDGDIEIDPPRLLSRSNKSEFTVVNEYYDVDNTYISSESKYIGRTNTFNIDDLLRHVKGEEFFNVSKIECEEKGLQLMDIFAFIQERNQETIIMYVHYKVDFINEKED